MRLSVSATVLYCDAIRSTFRPACTLTARLQADYATESDEEGADVKVAKMRRDSSAAGADAAAGHAAETSPPADTVKRAVVSACEGAEHVRIARRTAETCGRPQKETDCEAPDEHDTAYPRFLCASNLKSWRLGGRGHGPSTLAYNTP